MQGRADILVVCLVQLSLLTACAVAPSPVPTAPPATTSAPAPRMSNAIHWVRSSAEYRAILHQTYRAATSRVEELARGRQPFTWAVAIDGDDTILDNSSYWKEREALGLGYDRDSWYAWVARKAAPALPGAVEFLEAVRGLGGKIVVVTNRDEILCLATEDNLTAQRVPFDTILCRPANGPGDKEPRWQAIEQGSAAKYLPPLEILLWVGDGIGDFPGATQALRDASPAYFDKFGDRWFMLPNPMYGSWERNPQE